MHSSTSSSELQSVATTASSAGTAPALEPTAPPIPERHLPAVHFGQATIAAAIVFVTLLGGWEAYWRNWGSVPSYQNSEGLWAIQRRRISNGEGNATVLIGSSRTLSNIQLHVWERLDGRRPIQLALEGTSPLRALEGLADDPAFTGRLLVGISPGLFFSGYGYRGAVFDYYPKETPSQRAGQQISMALIDPYFAFFDPDFALFTVLKRQPWPQRPGAPARMEVRKLFVSEADRNMHLWEKVEKDVAYQDLAKSIWAQNFVPPPPEKRAAMAKVGAEQLERAVVAVEKLKQRGVEVIFVLHPVDGRFAEFELGNLPRAHTWDVLIQRTGARGIHFQDYPELQGLWLPEWSHLATADAEIYTERLYKIIYSPERAAQPQAAGVGTK